MRRTMLVLALASLIGASEARADQSVVAKPWQDRFLPAPTNSVPWLAIDWRTRWPKGDFPLGRRAEGLGQLALQPVPNIQMSFRDDLVREQGGRM
jgi:hypothetical protein